MNLILLGPPGAEKAPRPRASPPSMARPAFDRRHAESRGGLRQLNRARGEGGHERADLVPDAIVVQVIAERIDQSDCAKGVIFDGFPRTLAQADALDKLMKEKKKKLDVVVEIKVDDRRLIERIVGRFACASCGASYHDRFHRPRFGTSATCATAGASRDGTTTRRKR